MTNGFSLDLESTDSQYASIADASQTGLDLSGDFTLECWIKPESLGALNNLITKWSDQSSQASYTFATNSLGFLDLVVSDDGTYTDGHRLRFVSSDRAVTTGAWYHVAVTFDISAETCIFYVNGAAAASSKTVGTSMGATLKNSTAPFAIGTNFNSSGTAVSFYDGLIDEVRVWNDVRTQSEIENNMEADLTPGVNNLVEAWSFNNNYTSKSGNNNLTAVNTPSFSTGVPFANYEVVGGGAFLMNFM